MNDRVLNRKVGEAIKLFWLTREQQTDRQGRDAGKKDAGLRAAVTGGKHLDGFTTICRDLFIESGVPEAHVYWRKKRELPGFYRAEKNWDLIVVADGHLLAIIEFKAQVGPSFGNNFNNRTEEALGNATDLWAAYREGAFEPSPRPWLGYVFILEDCAVAKSNQREAAALQGLPRIPGSFVHQTLRVVADKAASRSPLRWYVSPADDGGRKGKFTTSSAELSFRTFAASLSAKAIAFAKSR